MKKKPIIALTTEHHTSNNDKSVITNYPYIDSIVCAGGVPILLPLTDEEVSYGDVLSFVDGIVFIGGEDILPCYYGEDPIKGIGEISVVRDRSELALFHRAYQKKYRYWGSAGAYNSSMSLLEEASIRTLTDNLRTSMHMCRRPRWNMDSIPSSSMKAVFCINYSKRTDCWSTLTTIRRSRSLQRV